MMVARVGIHWAASEGLGAGMEKLAGGVSAVRSRHCPEFHDIQQSGEQGFIGRLRCLPIPPDIPVPGHFQAMISIRYIPVSMCNRQTYSRSCPLRWAGSLTR